MTSSLKRRDFLKTTDPAGLGTALGSALPSISIASPRLEQAGKPVVISSGNGLKATALAMEMIQKGSDALDAVIAGVNVVEDDPKDNSVGLGGLPNEIGVVELDSSVMQVPRAAAQGLRRYGTSRIRRSLHAGSWTERITC